MYHSGRELSQHSVSTVLITCATAVCTMCVYIGGMLLQALSPSAQGDIAALGCSRAFTCREYFRLCVTAITERNLK